MEGLNTYVVMATNVCTCSKNRVYKYSVVSTAFNIPAVRLQYVALVLTAGIPMKYATIFM